ncbi:MAG: class I SAM-dependent methyltransferase [Opitutae bacterium]|nr:class I SAM-dependent methyltransferase [Opitutae bacterium]
MQAAEYRKMAGVEDAMWYYRALHRHVARSLAENLAEHDSPAVLDAGCGTGGLLRHLHAAQPAWRLGGLDFSPLACELARERTGSEITQGSILALPFADATFDAVTSCDVVCQVEEPARALGEFFRVLRPGGTLVLTLPAYAWLWSYHDEEVGNRRRYSRGETAALLAAAGFAAGRGTYWNMLPLPLAILRRKLFPPGRATSDVRLYPAPVEAIFRGMMALEFAWLRHGTVLPCGSTVLAVGRKPV